VSRGTEILHAAARLFRERGFDAVGVDDIGRAVGLTGPAIYRHFSSKDELLATLFDQGMTEVFRVTTVDAEDPFEVLGAMAREHARHVVCNPLLSGIWIHEGRALTGIHWEHHRHRVEQYLARWTAALRRCYPGTSESVARTVAHATLGALNASNDWPSGLRDDAALERLVAYVVNGTRVLAAETP
jgi:AcrR family transcriptional regulator